MLQPELVRGRRSWAIVKLTGLCLSGTNKDPVMADSRCCPFTTTGSFGCFRQPSVNINPPLVKGIYIILAFVRYITLSTDKFLPQPIANFSVNCVCYPTATVLTFISFTTLLSSFFMFVFILKIIFRRCLDRSGSLEPNISLPTIQCCVSGRRAVLHVAHEDFDFESCQGKRNTNDNRFIHRR